MIPSLLNFSDTASPRSIGPQLFLAALFLATPVYAQESDTPAAHDPNQILESIPIKRGHLDWVSIESVPES